MTDSEPPILLKFHPDRDEPELVEFYTTLGMCVSSWAFIDRRLYEIFHDALKMDYRQSALLYYRQRAFNQRLRIVDDTLRSYLAKDVFNTHWKALHGRVVELSHTRNIFAHHPTKRTASAKDGKPIYAYTINIEYYERVLNQEYKGLLGKDVIGIEELKAHDQELERMERDLRWFLGAFIGPQGCP